MNKLKKFVALALVLCMVLTVMPVYANAASEDFLRVYHLDCGRKFFDTADVEELIDLLSETGYTHLELALGNDGLRLILDDMSVLTYDSAAVTAGVKAGNIAYSHAGEWTEAQMDAIIDYAAARNIEIIPLINTPGHMDAILDAMESVGINGAYNGSKRTVDVTNADAVAFTQALVAKYVDYFAARGCTYFNLGADEYANDVYQSGAMGFGHLQTYGLYDEFAAYVNGVAAIIKDAGMTPIAFNDGLYFNGNSTAFDTDIVAAYWTSGWGSYKVASAATLANKGHKILNTNDGWYYVLGRASGTYGYSGAANAVVNTPVTDVPGSNDPAVIGSMACLWCDEPEVSYASYESDVHYLAETLADSNPDYFVAASAEEEVPETTEPPATSTSPETAAAEERTITLSVGGTATDTITGGEYAADETKLNKSVATVSVETTPAQEATVSYAEADVTTGDLISSNSTYQATNYYYQVSGVYYPVYASRVRYSNNSNNRYNYTWYYSADNGATFTQIGTQTYARSYDDVNITVYTKSGNDAVPASTTVTFNGVAVGTTYVTVGNVNYTINVVAEDLDRVSGLTVEYWITNIKVTANNANSKTISARDAYGEKGVLISTLIPATGKNSANADVAFWKTTRLASNNKQTTGAGVNKTLAGTDFTYIRYYGGSWAYSADGVSWTNVASGDQIVAYYLQSTEVTDEVTTQVVDWGEKYGNSYNDANYVLVDYAVKYESGERTPDAFPINNVTQKFHCNYNSQNDISYGNVVRDSSTGVYYRNLWSIRAVETSEYEVYMITLTPTADSATDYLSSGADSEATGQIGFYAGTEKVVWVDNEANLGNFADESLHYTSISGDVKFTVGGEPVVEQLEIYNRHGMLVTYYVRAKATEDSLTVHYIDASVQGAELEFYAYNIAVKEGTLFHEQIGEGYAEGEIITGNVSNGSVVNYYGRTQNVSADLRTLSQVGAQYLYTEYKCFDVIRSEDGKDVYLYYTFDPTVYFVADFGLPMDITAVDLSDKLQGVEVESITFSGTPYTSYGVLSGNGTQTITYRPNKTIDGVDYFTLLVTTKTEVGGILDEASSKIAFRVYIVPATTVYYEQEAPFVTYTGSWSNGTGTGKQETQTKDEAPYGYTAAYNTIGASNGSEAVSTAAQDKATFSFTGTGVEIYANCDPDTSVVMVRLYDADGKLKKMYQVSTVTKSGSSDATSGQAVESFNLPIVSVTGLTHGTYTVELLHTKKLDDTTKELRLDGFRVIDPLNDLNSGYYTASEKEVTFLEVRDNVLAALNVEENADFSRYLENLYGQVYNKAGTTEGIVVLSGDPDVQDLLDNGPKNEIFLQPGATLNVNLSGGAQIGLKAVSAAATYSIDGGADVTLSSSTDMFYEISGQVTIRNTGDTLLSVTKLKLYKGTGLREVTTQQLGYALSLMGFAPADGEITAPEQDVFCRDAVLNVGVVDYRGARLADVTLTANGVQGENHTFTAAEILAAVKAQLPEAYALVDETKIADVEVAYGDNTTIKTQAGKAAVVTVTYVDRRTGAVVGEAQLVSVQTSSRSWVQFTAADIRAAAPAGRKAVQAQSLKATYGYSYSLVIAVI